MSEKSHSIYVSSDLPTLKFSHLSEYMDGLELAYSKPTGDCIDLLNVDMDPISSSPEFKFKLSEICTKLRLLPCAESGSPKIKSLWLALEAHIETNSVSDTDNMLIHTITHKYLTFCPKINEKWLENGHLTNYYYYPLRVVLKLKPTTELAFPVIAAASLHYMEGLPWTNHQNSSISGQILDNYGVTSLTNQFTTWLKPQLLSLSPKQQSLGKNLGNKSVSNAGYRQKIHSINGLRPSLGFNLSYEDGTRSAWKSSPNVMAISSVYYILNNTNLGDNWPIITSFILNLLEDHEVFFKAQGCILLRSFVGKNPSILTRSGLLDLYLSAVKVCMSYLPNLTPEKESLYILNEAFPTAFDLLHHYSNPTEAFILLLNENMFSTIQYVYDRSDKVVVLVLKYIHLMIHNYMKSDVFACLSRLFYTVNQLLTGPLLFDRKKEMAFEISTICLKIQADVFELVEKEGGSSLLRKYNYDFITVWSVLYQRLSREDFTCDEIKENYKQLKMLDGDVDKIAEELCLARPELKPLFN